MTRRVLSLALEPLRLVTFALGEYGGWLLDVITGHDPAVEEAQIRADIIRQAEGL